MFSLDFHDISEAIEFMSSIKDLKLFYMYDGLLIKVNSVDYIVKILYFDSCYYFKLCKF